jgi:hypothetical protein
VKKLKQNICQSQGLGLNPGLANAEEDAEYLKDFYNPAEYLAVFKILQNTLDFYNTAEYPEIFKIMQNTLSFCSINIEE